MSDEFGDLTGEIVRFEPFGAYRPGSGPDDITDRGFTGHRHNDGLGLVYMNARYYVGSIGRFASADSVVPNAANPQAFNRFSYGYNNPIRYTDPSGHCAGIQGDPNSPGYDGECWNFLENDFCNIVDCGTEGWEQWLDYGILTLAKGFSIVFGTPWIKSELETLANSIAAAQKALSSIGIDWKDTPLADTLFTRDDSDQVEWRNPLTGIIHITNNVFRGTQLQQMVRIWHEMGHAIDSGFGRTNLHDLYDEFSGNCPGIVCNQNAADGYYFREYGYEARPGLYNLIFGRQGETWADAFAAWVYHEFTMYNNVGDNLPSSFISGPVPPNWRNIYWAVEKSLVTMFG
jgi:RHS repeat-associated protein